MTIALLIALAGSLALMAVIVKRLERHRQIDLDEISIRSHQYQL